MSSVPDPGAIACTDAGGRSKLGAMLSAAAQQTEAMERRIDHANDNLEI